LMHLEYITNQINNEGYSQINVDNQSLFCVNYEKFQSFNS